MVACRVPGNAACSFYPTVCLIDHREFAHLHSAPALLHPTSVVWRQAWLPRDMDVGLLGFLKSTSAGILSILAHCVIGLLSLLYTPPDCTL